MFTEKRNWNGMTAVYYNGLFMGQYCDSLENFTQFSHNPNQIFDIDLSKKYVEGKTGKKVYSNLSHLPNQNYLEISTKNKF